MLVLGFLLLATWSWIILCAPDVFSWHFSFTVINLVQMLFMLYRLKPVKFSQELEEVYVTLFQPLKVSRSLFKKLISPEHATIATLQEGEVYATQNVTRTNKLGLLVSGMITVIANGQFLHNIHEKEFLDSPEFESTSNKEDKFQVSLIATEYSRCLVWQRSALKYLLAKEPFLAQVLSGVVGRDVTNKLYAINQKIMLSDGSRVDIRLPCINALKIKESASRSPSITRSNQRIQGPDFLNTQLVPQMANGSARTRSKSFDAAVHHKPHIDPHRARSWTDCHIRPNQQQRRRSSQLSLIRQAPMNGHAMWSSCSAMDRRYLHPHRNSCDHIGMMQSYLATQAHDPHHDGTDCMDQHLLHPNMFVPCQYGGSVSSCSGSLRSRSSSPSDGMYRELYSLLH
ncbi:popeye domain-containing protein 3 isoform X2 [Lingula anatina]|nr:popeye domain-containing protein 3 isoform X2 [Lingula anatina]|eukprot:XP_013396182.1 popeye domain-containing protein 3 isoform X2 [Lingula anatina]